MLALILVASLSAAPRVAVQDVVPGNKDCVPLASALGGLIANELSRLGAFEVTSTDQLRQLLSYERQQQLLGCPNESCSSSIGAQLGMDYLVAGRLNRAAGAKGQNGLFTLELTLLDVKQGKRDASDVTTAGSESELISKLSPSVVKLVGAILKARSGTLVVLSSETGATVKIDDTVVGTTPLAGKLSVAGGPHYVQVEKDGFVAFKKEVRIQPDQLTEESVHMVPSPDFIEGYESKQKKLRIGAYIAGGVAAAAFAAGIVMENRAGSLYGSTTTNNTFLYHRNFVVNGIEIEGDVDHRARAGQLKADIELSQTLGAVMFGVAGLGAAGAVALWLLGDDPNRYAAYREVKVAAVPTPGGAMAVLGGSF